MTETLSWLLEGDPAIHWLVHRDLLGSPSDVVEGERARIATEGWGIGCERDATSPKQAGAAA